MSGPPIAYPDALKVAGEYCLLEAPPYGVSVLYPLCETRVYLDGSPSTFRNAGYCLVFDGAANLDVSVPLDAANIRIRCYAGENNPEGCRTLARALVLHLHRAFHVETTSGVLISARQVGGGEMVRTPPTVWPYVLVYFRVLVKALEI